MAVISLRAYQERSIAETMSHLEGGTNRVLYTLPTGGGKTVIASEIVRRVTSAGMPAIFLAHRRELIKQTFAKLVRNGLDAQSIGVVMAGVDSRTDRNLVGSDATDEELWHTWARRRPRAPIQVGSIDTFRNRAKPFLDVDRVLVIVDEAHRALAKSYRDVESAYPRAWHLGLTATPIRADGKPLSAAYDALVIGSTFADLVREGALVEPTCYGTKVKADLSAVRKSGADYNQEELAAAVDRSELIGDVIDHWKRHGNDAATFCFAASVAHSKHLAERFVEAGIAARHVDGGTDTTERDAAIRDLALGKVKVLCNCAVFTEGTDVPAVKTIILARPTLSEALYLQMAGRGARPFHGQPFVILDHAGCCSSPLLGGLPQEPREWTLDGKRKRDASGRAPVKECPGCGALVPTATAACLCGHVFDLTAEEESRIRQPEEKEGELVELSPGQHRALGEWKKIVDRWDNENFDRMARGQKLLEPRWVSAMWKGNHVGWFPRGAKLPRYTDAQKEYKTRRAGDDAAYRKAKAKRSADVERMMVGP